MGKTFLLVAVFTAFLALKLFNAAFRISDENFYYYTASLIARGYFPYRDFFFQHLPTQVFLYSVAIRVFGFHLTLFRLIHLLATLGSAFVLYRIVSAGKRKTATAVVAPLLFLFSILVLATTDMALGVHEATFFLLLSWLLLPRFPKLAGVFLFVGSSIRLYILPAAIGFAGYTWVRHRQVRGVLEYFFSWLLPFLGLNLYLFLLFGEKFLTPVWRYHFMKSSLRIAHQVLPDFARNDLIMVAFALAALYVMLKRYRPWRLLRENVAGYPHLVDTGFAAAAAALVQFVFLASLRPVFPMYLVTLIPFLAVLATLALTVFLPRRSRRAAVLLVVAVAVMNAFLYQRHIAKQVVIGEIATIVSDVRTITREGEPIFGEYTIAPLIALLTQREITNYEIDTNVMRFATGLLNPDTATFLATHSAVVLQNGYVDDDSGHVKYLEPYFIWRDELLRSCTLFRTYRVVKDLQYNRIFAWACTVKERIASESAGETGSVDNGERSVQPLSAD